MKVILNKEECIGCGSCVNICPNHFAYDDDGKSKVTVAEFSNEESEVKDAEENCPTQAITIESDKDEDNK